MNQITNSKFNRLSQTYEKLIPMYDLDQTFLSNNFLHKQIFDNSATQSAWSSPPF